MSAAAAPTAPRPGALALAAGIAGGATAWAAFLWQQLLVARRGGDPFCALGGGCGALWDCPLASGVHALTGLPVAAWGVVWGLVALALPLWAGLRLRGGRAAEPAWSGTLATAAAGLMTVAVLAATSLTEGSLCTNCLITYGLVLVYAAAVGLEARRALPVKLGAGAGAAALATLACALLLFLPGRATPRVGDSLGAGAMAARPPSGADDPVARLTTALDQLPRDQRQLLANARAAWQASPPAAASTRPLFGARFAAVKITTLTDASCSHCAGFHDGLAQLLRAVPPDSVSIESRMFPLEQSCNPHAGGTGHPERCMLARARLCIGNRPGAWELDAELFRRRGDVSEEELFGLAGGVMPARELRACMASPETTQLLEQDLALAVATGIRGTPHVLLNDRPTLASLPFLYAMAVTGGDAEHAVFGGLPAPTGDFAARPQEPARAQADARSR
jgi:serine/threonine-protein kinase